MQSFRHLSVNELLHMLTDTKTVQLADIRDAASYAAGHIEHSFNLNNENIAQFMSEADMDAPLVVICYHGISSQSAAVYLNEQGFDDIYSLDGGYQAWQQANN